MKLLKEQSDFVATNVMIEFYLCHYLNALELMVEILQGKVLINNHSLVISYESYDIISFIKTIKAILRPHFSMVGARKHLKCNLVVQLVNVKILEN